MELKKLQLKGEYNNDKKLTERLECFEKLLSELRKKDLPDQIVNSINEDIDKINTFAGTGNDLLKQVRKLQAGIVKTLEKKLKLVTKNHYRNVWLVVGMSAFGIPMGVTFGLSVGNLSLLAIGLPVGMGIGMAIGTAMDKKAKDAGKQLDVELKY